MPLKQVLRFSLTLCAIVSVSCSDVAPDATSRDHAPTAVDHESPSVRVVDRLIGREVDHAVIGLVRADTVTVVARGKSGDVFDDLRKGDYVYAAADGYDAARVRVTESTTPITIELERAGSVASVVRPDGWDATVGSVHVMVTHIVPGEWRKGRSDMRWGGPVALKTERWIDEFPVEVPVPSGMETKVYLEAREGVIAPLGWTVVPGQTLASTFVALADIDLVATTRERPEDWLVLPDWSRPPDGGPELLDSFAGALSRPTRP